MVSHYDNSFDQPKEKNMLHKFNIYTKTNATIQLHSGMIFAVNNFFLLNKKKFKFIKKLMSVCVVFMAILVPLFNFFTSGPLNLFKDCPETKLS